MSNFLVPQKVIANPFEEIETSPLIVVEQNYFKQQSEEVITQNYFDLLYNQTHAFPPNQRSFSPSLLPQQSDYSGYQWSQHNNVITITYKSTEPISKDSIIITENDIQSPFLSGNFFDKVVSNEIIISNNNVIITLNVEKPFPILIISGNMDKYSCFFLAAMSMSVQQEDLFVKLLIKSAMQSFIPAMTSIGYYYRENKMYNHALYWFYQYALASKDVSSYPLLCDLLLAIDEQKYVHIVENILIAIANINADALITLSQLYLSPIPGFNSDVQLAIQYLEFAIQTFKSDQAVKILASLYLEGKVLHRDTEKAKDILLNAGYLPEKVDKLINDFIKKYPLQETQLSLIDTIADYSISALLIAGAAAATVFVINFFRNRSK